MRAVAVLGVLSTAGAATFCVGTPAYYSSKYARVDGPRPARLPAELTPEWQVEPHTCGYHAMTSVYRAYGLDDAACDLRFRLGTDRPVNVLARGSTGTIHPDLVRVLRQDGFAVEHVFPGASDAPAAVARHLSEGHALLALTNPGGLHWVAVSRLERGEVTVCDSLSDESYAVGLRTFLSDQAYSLLLIRPARSTTGHAR